MIRVIKYNSRKNSSKNLEDGFVLFLIIGFLPVLLAFLLGLTYIGRFIYVRSELLYQCHTTLLKAQALMARALTVLENLNPIAENLRLQEKKLKIALQIAISSNPSLIPEIKRRIIENQIKQSEVALQQQTLISTSETEASNLVYKFQTQNNLNPKVLKTHLAVEKRPATAIAPNYYTAPDFESNQTIGVRISNPVLMSPWLNQIDQHNSDIHIPAERPALSENCSATISKGGQKWVAKLGTAKFSSNY